jgi:hypothetical protein
MPGNFKNGIGKREAATTLFGDPDSTPKVESVMPWWGNLHDLEKKERQREPRVSAT